MGWIENVVIAGVATAGGVIAAAAALGNKEKRLANLDNEFEEYRLEYEKEKARLQKKIEKGNKRAERSLFELEAEYRVEYADYKAKREKLLPKKSQADIESERRETEHRHRMEEIELGHAMEMEKMEYQNRRDQKITKSPVDVLQNELVCSNCRASINANDKFCSNCGYEVVRKRFCTNCGNQLNNDSRFCSKCGNKV